MSRINIYQGTVTAGGTTNTLFYAQVSSDDSELPATDRSVNISVTAKITTAS